MEADSTQPVEAFPQLAPEANSDSPSIELTGYELVADMMRRQDEVISQINDLNARIESAIEEITDQRKQEQQAQLESEQLTVGESSEIVENSPISRAA